ncbi:unnamed protein product [Lota lota]
MEEVLSFWEGGRIWNGRKSLDWCFSLDLFLFVSVALLGLLGCLTLDRTAAHSWGPSDFLADKYDGEHPTLVTVGGIVKSFYDQVFPNVEVEVVVAVAAGISDASFSPLSFWDM